MPSDPSWSKEIKEIYFFTTYVYLSNFFDAKYTV